MMLKADADGDGIPDHLEDDDDNDGVPDDEDTDDVGDGLSDADEGEFALLCHHKLSSQ